MNDLHETLESVFRNVFGDDSLVLRDEMSADDIEGWDSLMHVDLVIALERRFRIKFATAEIARLKAKGQNVGSLIALISRKLDGGVAL